jgi:hypothetical protein
MMQEAYAMLEKARPAIRRRIQWSKDLVEKEETRAGINVNYGILSSYRNIWISTRKRTHVLSGLEAHQGAALHLYAPYLPNRLV